MKRDYNLVFKSLQTIDPPKALTQAIFLRIERGEKHNARQSFALLAATALASLGGTIVAIIYLMGSLTRSGFMQYVSLFFSEQGGLIAYWKEISLSLVESLPIVGLVTVLSAFALFLWSASKATRYTKNAFQLA